MLKGKLIIRSETYILLLICTRSNLVPNNMQYDVLLFQKINIFPPHENQTERHWICEISGIKDTASSAYNWIWKLKHTCGTSFTYLYRKEWTAMATKINLVVQLLLISWNQAGCPKRHHCCVWWKYELNVWNGMII